jgi:hypothetical protein
MSEYHYIQSEPGLWTVGTGTPGKGGDWEPESDHESPEAAAERVRYLNGGYGTSADAAYITKLEKQIADLESALTEAVELIRQWHNMDTAGILTKQEHEMSWKIYQKNAPEMKRINAVLAKGKQS